MSSTNNENSGHSTNLWVKSKLVQELWAINHSPLTWIRCLWSYKLCSIISCQGASCQSLWSPNTEVGLFPFLIIYDKTTKHKGKNPSASKSHQLSTSHMYFAGLSDYLSPKLRPVEFYSVIYDKWQILQATFSFYLLSILRFCFSSTILMHNYLGYDLTLFTNFSSFTKSFKGCLIPCPTGRVQKMQSPLMKSDISTQTCPPPASSLLPEMAQFCKEIRCLS